MRFYGYLLSTRNTVFRHADKPIPENRGLNGTSGSNNSYDDNLAHN